LTAHVFTTFARLEITFELTLQIRLISGSVAWPPPESIQTTGDI
jgi:hypothetical protein